MSAAEEVRETTTPTSASELFSSGLTIHTYHHVPPCTHLCLATTTPLSKLPRRESPALDKSYILPLPPLPRSRTDESDEEGDEQSERKDDNDNDGDVVDEVEVQKSREKEKSLHYALLLSTMLDKTPQIIRRTDGFERRRSVRCGRCRGVVGYFLDGTSSTNTGASTDANANTQAPVSASSKPDVKKKLDGTHARVVYLIPGGLVETGDMVLGKEPVEKLDV